jgi:hypothetical protein
MNIRLEQFIRDRKYQGVLASNYYNSVTTARRYKLGRGSAKIIHDLHKKHMDRICAHSYPNPNNVYIKFSSLLNKIKTATGVYTVSLVARRGPDGKSPYNCCDSVPWLNADTGKRELQLSLTMDSVRRALNGNVDIKNFKPPVWSSNCVWSYAFNNISPFTGEN